MNIETMDRKLKQGITLAAIESIPKSKGRTRQKVVPWWDDECKEAVKNRNKAFKIVKRTLFSTFDSVQVSTGSSKRDNTTGKKIQMEGVL